MSIYDEMIVIGLKAYAEMLEIEIVPSDDVHAKLEQAKVLIVERLNQGARAIGTIDGFTPLMLYATFHVNDERFEEEFVKGEETILAYTHLRGEASSTNQRMNALACAVVSDNQVTVERLLATGYFMNERDYNIAVELIAMFNRANLVPHFDSVGCNFFIPDFPVGITPLMLACRLGHSEFVQAVLATSPSENQIGIRDNLQGRTAYDLARVGSHQEIVDLLETSYNFYFAKLCEIIRSQETDSLSSILHNSTAAGDNALIHADATGAHSLIAIAHNQDNEALRETLLEHFVPYYESLDPREQIQTLWLTLYGLQRNSERNAETIAFYTPQIEALLDEHACNMVEFTFNGLFGFNPILSDYAKRILKEADRLRCVRIPYACPDIQDHYDENNFGVACINLVSEFAIEFVSCILDKLQLVHCELLTDTIHKPLTDIVQYILVRNQEIAKSTSEEEQDKIHDCYQERINLKLIRFMSDERVESDERSVAKNLLRKNCSLKTLAALTFFNNPVIPKGVVKNSDIDLIVTEFEKALSY